VRAGRVPAAGRAVDSVLDRGVGGGDARLAHAQWHGRRDAYSGLNVPFARLANTAAVGDCPRHNAGAPPGQPGPGPAHGRAQEIRAEFGEALPKLMHTVGATPPTPECVGRVLTPSCLRWQSL
jgi:hypothetical protein